MRSDSNILFLEYSLFLIEQQTLVVSDLHLGYEEALQQRGVLIPKTQIKEILSRLETIFEKQPVKTVVLNGDIKHEFGKILTTEWREVKRLFDFLTLQQKNVIVVGGNHDKILEPICKEYGFPLLDRYTIDQYMCIHGDSIEVNIPENVTTLIMGHEHPSVGLRSGARTEKYKCFLVGEYGEHTVIVTPSFSTLTTGTDLLTYQTLSPYLEEGIELWDVYVPDETEVRYFGTIEDVLYFNEEESGIE